MFAKISEWDAFVNEKICIRMSKTFSPLCVNKTINKIEQLRKYRRL